MGKSFFSIRRKAFEFVDNIQRVSSISGIMDATVVALKEHGFDYFCCSFVDHRSTERYQDAVLAERLPAGLMDLYLEREYVLDDPALRYCKTTTRPFRWLRDSPYDPAREPRAVEVVQSFRDFGVLDGFVIPVVSPSGRLGQVWFGGGEVELPDQGLPALHFMALYAFDRVLQLNRRPDVPQIALTPREREVLTMVAWGMTSENIGEALNISARTVVEHLKNCSRKLGAATRIQAVVIAMRDRLIQP